MTPRRKVGLLGGTFDPIHTGHLDIALAALKELSLDEVWIMPAGNSYHKSRPKQSADGDDRADMVRAAVKDIEGLSFCDLELKRPGETYTADTLTELTARLPDTDFWFLAGSDSLDYMDRWVRPQDIFSRCTVAVAMRETQTVEEADEKIRALTDRYHASIVRLKTPVRQISSTELRARLREGKDVSAYIPEAAEKIIRSRHLYGCMAGLPNEAILADMKGKLSRERYAHVLRVADTAVLMADVLGEDEDRARLAAILHDCGKYGDRAGFTALCERFRIPVREVERQYPALLHGKLGAYYAKTRYGVDDEEILSAITWHTTGKPDMTLLEKIIFTADYIEPGRDEAPGLPELRRLSFTDLNAAVCRILGDTLAYLQEKGRLIDEMTQTAYDWYRQKGED